MLAIAASWRRDGRHGVELVTAVSTWGSSRRSVGSMLAVDVNGHMIGSVSDSCVEGSVVTEALAAIGDGKPCLQAWDVGLAYGGEVSIFVQRLDDDSEAACD
ncbi:MAG TPA: XdhC family protein [Gammaproteobacteria bacterium]|nr:XdhC family protein [Gammaproteobacteria bacterium]